MQGQHRPLHFGFNRVLAVCAAAAALANAVFLAHVACAYAVAWPAGEVAVLRAARLLPYTADSYAPDLSLQAGHLLDSQGRTAEGLVFYRASLARDPYNNPGWLLVALAEERLGNAPAAERAYREAYAREPNRAESDWMYANFLLRARRSEESLAVFRRVLEHGRRFDWPVFATVAQILAPAELERRILPAGAGPQLAYLRFALASGDAGAVARTWPRLAASYTLVTPAELTAACQLLARNGDYRLSRLVWLDWMAGQGPARGAALSNGGFDAEPAPGPFDWMFYPGPAVDAYRDTAVFLTPGSSAHLYFTGAGNFDGIALEQWLNLEPGVRYRLSFAWRARNLTGDCTPRIELLAGTTGTSIASAETEPGSWGWRRETLHFRAPAALVRLAVSRHASGKLDGRIAGDFWIDDFVLDRE